MRGSLPGAGTLLLEIAGVSLLVEGAPRKWREEPSLARFLVPHGERSTPAVRVTFADGSASTPGSSPLAGASGRRDVLGSDGSLWLRRPGWSGHADADRGVWRFWIERAPRADERLVGHPWLLVVVWGDLARRAGAYLHGALCVLDGRYVLLLGDSGVGKSTLSELILESGGSCLTDEHPVSTPGPGGRPFVHATPWPGPRGAETSLSGPLDAVFFLRHAPTDDLRGLSRSETGRRLLGNARFYRWDPSTIPATVEALDRIAREVPAFDLGFVPRPSAVGAVRAALRTL